MLKACSVSKSINRQAIKILRENNISIDVWNGENSPTEEELKELLHIYDILIIGVKERITNSAYNLILLMLLIAQRLMQYQLQSIFLL